MSSRSFSLRVNLVERALLGPDRVEKGVMDEAECFGSGRYVNHVVITRAWSPLNPK